MNLDEFRSRMLYFRHIADEEGNAYKNSQIALDKLCSIYVGFNDDERRMAQRVILEWVLSDDEGVRFDALALINEFRIVASVPILRILEERLNSSVAPSAPYELKKIQRIISKLES